jgi:hypothetical protein
MHAVLVTPREVIRASGDGIYDGMVRIRLSVPIGADGRVEETEPIDSQDHFHQEAKAKNIELHRVFQPVLDGNGASVRAHFTDYVEVLPPERWLDHSMPFPERIDLSTFSITLKRSSGMISCRKYSGYETTVSGSGDVTWAIDGIAIRQTTISHEAVQELVEQVRDSRMLAALDRYESKWTDGPCSH